mmetsp:Transcript_37654/g.120997  ORF Transcript_37654/g.120997 Transcript_37654/m.120997 type:complete len:502 (+) Transcript_37654:288-1793(+)
MEPRQRRGSHRRGRLHPRTGCGGRHIAGRRAPLRLPPGQHELGGRGDAHRPGRPRRHRRADPFAGRRQRHRLGLRRLHFLPRRAGGLLCRGPHCRHHRPPPDHPAQAEHLHAGLAARGAQCHARLRHAPLHRSRPRLPPNAGWACHLRRGMRCHNRRGANVPRRDLAAPPARRPGHVLPADVLHGHPARPDPRPSRRLRPRALVGRLPAAASPPRGRTVGTSGPSGGEPPLAGEPDRRRGYAGAAGAGPLARGERRQPGRHPGARHDADELGRGVRPAGRRQGHRHHARPAEDAQGPPDLCRVRHRTAVQRDQQHLQLLHHLPDQQRHRRLDRRAHRRVDEHRQRGHHRPVGRADGPVRPALPAAGLDRRHGGLAAGAHPGTERAGAGLDATAGRRVGRRLRHELRDRYGASPVALASRALRSRQLRQGRGALGRHQLAGQLCGRPGLPPAGQRPQERRLPPLCRGPVRLLLLCQTLRARDARQDTGADPPRARLSQAWRQ